MMISTKGRYALRVMIDICEHDNGEYITLKDIASRQEISEKYLESIISVLSKAGILDGLRGKGGGYRLTRKPEEYSVGEILRLVEGPIAPVACLESESNKCTRAGCCNSLPMWEKLNTIINEYLDGISLGQLLSGECI
ncbi:MAG: RrF2 family transcriptional regulator [Clostridia bacterium]|nr:RrF2 family transcriptional regulator [Oscillospiraceae bacterium]MBR4034159.1 RrF2 family transcriptional regulator [Clostridia bacterium]